MPGPAQQLHDPGTAVCSLPLENVAFRLFRMQVSTYARFLPMSGGCKLVSRKAYRLVTLDTRCL